MTTIDIYILDIDVENNMVYGKTKEGKIVGVKIDFDYGTTLHVCIQDEKKFDDFLSLYSAYIHHVEKIFSSNINWSCPHAIEFGCNFNGQGRTRPIPQGTPYRVFLNNQKLFSHNSKVEFKNFLATNGLVFGFDIVLETKKDAIHNEILFQMLDKTTEHETLQIYGSWISLTTSDDYIYFLKRTTEDYDNIKSLHPCKPIWGPSTCTIIPTFVEMFFDIEVGSRYVLDQLHPIFSNGNSNHIIQLVSLLIRKEKKETYLVLVNREDVVVKNYIQDDGPIKVIFYENQKSLIESLMKLFMKADIIGGHNIRSYDNRELLTWIYVFQCECFNMYQSNIKAMLRNTESCKITLPWQIMVDSLIYFKLLGREANLSLDFLSEKHLNENKVALSYIELNEMMFKFYTDGNFEGIVDAIFYNMMDTILTFRLMENRIASFIQFCFSCHMSPSTYTLSFSTVPHIESMTKVPSILLRRPFVERLNIGTASLQCILLERPDFYKGGFVYEVDKNVIIDKKIEVLDVSSLYPSACISRNCNETCMIFSNKQYHEYFNSIPEDVRKQILKEVDIVEENDIKYITLKSKQRDMIGTYSLLEIFYVGRRREVRSAMTKVKDKSSVEFLILNSTQETFKLAANGIYGLFAARREMFEQRNPSMLEKGSTHYLRNPDAAATITTIGRNVLKDSDDFIKQNNFGTVVYGDTDSLFIQNPHSDVTPLLNAYIKQIYSNVSFESEGQFDVMIQDKKKSYILINTEKKTIKIRGMKHSNARVSNSIKKMLFDLANTLIQDIRIGTDDDTAKNNIQTVIGENLKEYYHNDNIIQNMSSYQKINIHSQVLQKLHKSFMFYVHPNELEFSEKKSYITITSNYMVKTNMKSLTEVPLSNASNHIPFPKLWIETVLNLLSALEISEDSLIKIFYDHILNTRTQTIANDLLTHYKLKDAICDYWTKCKTISAAIINANYTCDLYGSHYRTCQENLLQRSVLEVSAKNWDTVTLLSSHNIYNGFERLNRKEKLTTISIEKLRGIYDAKYVCIHCKNQNNKKSIAFFVHHLLLLNKFQKSAERLKDILTSGDVQNVLIQTPIGYLSLFQNEINFFDNLLMVQRYKDAVLKLNQEIVSV